MNYQIPSESTIVNGLCQLDCTIFSIEDVIRSLSENITNKKIVDRFISWLVLLQILDQKRQSWGTNLYSLSSNYIDNCIKTFKNNPNDPLSVHSKSIQLMIKSDINCGMQWFLPILKDTQLRKFLNSPVLRLSRIYSTILLENESFSYNPNSFHIGCICLAMTSVFSRDANLSADFAESIAFYLTKIVHLIIPQFQNFLNNQLILNHFKQIDELLKIKAPEQSKAIQNNKSGSIYFGIRYEQLLFSRENHNISDIFDIWDQIFAHITRTEFISCLTVAHIMQIQIPSGPQNVNDMISNWKNWDTVKIIKDALEMLEHKRSFREKFCSYFCPSFNLSGYDVSSLKI